MLSFYFCTTECRIETLTWWDFSSKAWVKKILRLKGRERYVFPSYQFFILFFCVKERNLIKSKLQAGLSSGDFSF